MKEGERKTKKAEKKKKKLLYKKKKAKREERVQLLSLLRARVKVKMPNPLQEVNQRILKKTKLGQKTIQK